MNYFQFTVIQQQTYGLYTKEKRKERHREKTLERKAKQLRNGYLYDAELGSAIFLF